MRPRTLSVTAGLMEVGAVPRWMGRMYAAQADSVKAEARKARELVEASAALALFATINNTKEGWVNLGRSYQRLTLRAAALGVSHSLLNMPCEEKAVRQKLKRKLGYENAETLLLVRLGYEEEGTRDEGQSTRQKEQGTREVIRSVSHLG